MENQTLWASINVDYHIFYAQVFVFGGRLASCVFIFGMWIIKAKPLFNKQMVLESLFSKMKNKQFLKRKKE